MAQYQELKRSEGVVHQSAGSNVPPPLSFHVPKTSDLPNTLTPWSDAPLPADILLLTVEDCEMLACYAYLRNCFKTYLKKLGFVYFGTMGESEEEALKVALMKCSEDSCGPGGALVTVKNAVMELRPKAVFSVGVCMGLNPEDTKVGDVVVSSKLTTEAFKTPVGRDVLPLVRHAYDGWTPPLRNAEDHKVQVFCDGEMFSGMDPVSAKQQCLSQVAAFERSGGGLFVAAHDLKIEWVIVKGISHFGNGCSDTEKSWKSHACVMAASLVSNMLKNSVFKQWPHYEDSSQGISMTKGKREPSSPSSQDSKGIKLEDEFLNDTQGKLRSRYTSSLSQVMISPCNREPTVGIDDVYVELSFLRVDIKPAGTTKQKLEEYWKIFDSHGHRLIPTRLLVYGRPGIGKSTFTKKLSADWSRDKNEVLKKFTVLLSVNLRDICGVKDPCSMIEESGLLARDDPMVDFDRLYNYILHNQKKVLLVLDGYDEYNADKSLLFHEIWSGKRLRDCTVLVTTRSSRKNELTPDSDVQFELNGFDSEGKIKDYVRKFLDHQEDFDDFVTYLNNQNLRGFAEIPLFLLMLCLTWKHGIPTSRPNLYERFILTLVGHRAVKGDEYKKNHDHSSTDEYKDDLSKLEKLAFHALLEDRLYLKFTNLSEDIREVVKKFVSVGLLQMSKFSSSPFSENGAFFLHKTIQEFLSACYIIQGLKTAKEVDRTCLSEVDSFEKVKKMVEALKFVCERSSELAIPVLKHLKIIGKKERLRTVHFSETPSLDDLCEKQKEFRIICLDFALSCPASESDKTDVYLEFLQCVEGVLLIDPIKQLPIVAREHVMNKFANFDSSELSYIFFDKADGTTSDDLFSMLFELDTAVVTCYGETKDIEEYTDLKEYVSDYFLKKEAQRLILYLTNIMKVSKVLRNIELLRVLTSSTIAPDQRPVDHVLESTGHQEKKHSLSFVRHVTLWGATAEELAIGKCVLSFASKPQRIDIPQLPKGCDDLIQSIPFTDNLSHLKLTLNDDAVASIAKSLHQAPKLKMLILSGDILHGSVRNFLENLQYLTQLTQLKLPCASLVDEDCRVLAKSLQYLCCLKELNLSDNPLGQGIRELAKHLTGVPLLTYLELWNTQMGKEEVAAVACSLKSISKLEVLNLSSNPLCQGIIELCKHLRRVPHLTTLEMMATQMGKEEVEAVARVLKHLPALKLLNLSRNNALGRGVSKLTGCLSIIPHHQLGELRLEGIQITEKDACKLLEVAQDRGFDVFLHGHNSRSAKRKNPHPITNNWQARHGEKVLECVVEKCPAVVHGLEHVADVFPNDPDSKTYIFYYFSQAEEDGVNMGPERENRSFQEGTPLIPMLRREGYKHMCVGCFEKHFPVILSDIRDSLQGRATFVNPDKTLHPGETQMQ